MKTSTHVIFGTKHLSFAALLLALLTTVACNRSSVQAAAPVMPAPLVSVVKASTQDCPK